MALTVERPNLPNPPRRDSADLPAEERVSILEGIVSNLISSLGNYALIPAEYAETVIPSMSELTGSLDDLRDGTAFGKVSISNLDAGIISITSSNISDVSANADNTAANNQASSWLSTKIEAGEIRITSGGDTVLLNSVLIDHAADWTDANPTGLYLTTQFLGYWNTTSNTWPTVINSDGTFSFLIDANNEVSHDGTSITIKADKGKIGSATNFFDITNGTFQTKATGSQYLYIANSDIFISSGAAGGGTRFLTMGYDGFNAVIDVRATGGTGASFVLKSGDGTRVLSLGVFGDIVTYTIRNHADNASIRMTETQSECIVNGFTITNATIAGTNSIDAAAVDSGTMDGARVSGGTFGAVNGSALTALNASNLATGTVALARLPSTVAETASGFYTGNNADRIVNVGFNIDRLEIKNTSTGDTSRVLIQTSDGVVAYNPGSGTQDSDLSLDNSTTFRATNASGPVNTNGEKYYWTATG